MLVVPANTDLGPRTGERAGSACPPVCGRLASRRQSGSDQARRRDHGQFRWFTESNGEASSASLHTERSLGVAELRRV
jgi:hypothetical protein